MYEEHSVVIIRCQVESDPPASISWRKDGMVIPDDGRYFYFRSGLMIEDATAEDAGVYICRATIDDLGILEETSITLNIYRMYTVKSAYKDHPRGWKMWSIQTGDGRICQDTSDFRHNVAYIDR